MSESGGNAVANRLPLEPTPFIPLALGSVRATGWLANQLRLQADGMTGHAETVIPQLGPDSAWRGGDGEDWEKGPYYLRGLVSLAYLLDDAALVAKATSWIDAILASQQPSGQIGPASNLDWWPRMVVTWTLRDHYEATGDARIIPALLKYARYMAEALPTQPLKEWARARVADQIDTLFWLYNRTGETFLLELAETLREQGNHWNEFFHDLREPDGDFLSTHAVNVSQAMKYPVVLAQRGGVEGDKTIFGRAWSLLRERHGLGFGMWSGTERLAGHADNQGVELCSMVEQILSNAMALKVLADPTIGDEQERIAFNLLAGSTTKDFHQHQYYTQPNAPAARRSPKGLMPFQEDHGDDLLVSPHSGFHCCCYNLHMGWPKYVQYAWMATSDDGLAVVAHGPTTVMATVSGVGVSITSTTNYPFEDTVAFTVSAETPVEFPLSIRIPGWCEAPRLSVNGTAVDGVRAGTFARIARRWQTGDVVTAEFTAAIAVTTGATEAKTIWRGPLAFSLRIKEQAHLVTQGPPGFDEVELTAASPWNYALELDGTSSSLAAELIRSAMPVNPWLPDTTPIRLSTAARRLSEWTMIAGDRLADAVPKGPVAATEPREQVELVPCGAQTLRITAFPWVPMNDS